MSTSVNRSLDGSLEPNPKRQKLDSDIKEFLSGNCNHLFISNGICISCKSTVDKSHQAHSFTYLNQWTPFAKQVLASTKRVTSQKSWINDKKLHLVLDLDQTLIQTIKVSKLSESDKYLTEEAESRTDLFRSDIGYPSEILIKLRPFVHEFLKQANEMFTMSVYTKSGYDYAQRILDLIDPEKIYFGDRVITRRESSGLKTLDLVLADERGTLILDDNRCVWPNHIRNLLRIPKYIYFRSNDVVKTERSLSSSECSKKRDESNEKGPLVNALRILKYVHKGFFCDWSEEKVESMDVRNVLPGAALRSKVKVQTVVLK